MVPRGCRAVGCWCTLDILAGLLKPSTFADARSNAANPWAVSSCLLHTPLADGMDYQPVLVTV